MECPKCNKRMEFGFTWIEHDGIGHPGPQTWICSCGYIEPLKLPEMEVTCSPILNENVWVKEV